jgi:branched-subunit amino acid ABC-type transport system permease component
MRIPSALFGFKARSIALTAAAAATIAIIHLAANVTIINAQQQEQHQEQQLRTSEATSLTDFSLDTTRAMTIVYSLLFIGVIWKFIRYMGETRRSKLIEIS